MAEDTSVLYSIAEPKTGARSWSLAPYRTGVALFLQIMGGFALIMATVWTIGSVQRLLFWTSAAWFGVWGLVALCQNGGQGFKVPSARLWGLMLFAALLLSSGLMMTAAGLGTLHGLFGTRDPLRHASGYICWAIIQQYIQQSFFFSRFEQLTNRGWLASLFAASLFGVAHLPNPVLAPVTFVGGWLMSELFRRYRTVLPLGLGHGMIGIAIAVSVPDHLQHHMRVGLSYLHYLT
jgi:hypothetical protein